MVTGLADPLYLWNKFIVLTGDDKEFFVMTRIRRTLTSRKVMTKRTARRRRTARTRRAALVLLSSRDLIDCTDARALPIIEATTANATMESMNREDVITEYATLEGATVASRTVSSATMEIKVEDNKSEFARLRTA